MHCGQGLSKEAAVQQFGDATVQKWRRSHDTRPPHGESLKDTRDRTLAFFKSTIEPQLAEGHNVLLVAHGNVLRCFLSYLSGLTNQEMLRLQVSKRWANISRLWSSLQNGSVCNSRL